MNTLQITENAKKQIAKLLQMNQKVLFFEFLLLVAVALGLNTVFQLIVSQIQTI